MFWTYLKKAAFIIVHKDGCTDRLELNKSQGTLDLFRRGNYYVIKYVESRTAGYTAQSIKLFYKACKLKIYIKAGLCGYRWGSSEYRLLTPS